MAITLDGTTGITTPGVVNTAAETIATTLAVTGVTTLQAGTAALPALTTTGDTNTGIFFPAADTIAFTEGGAEAMRIDSSGNVGIKTTTPSTFAFNNLVVASGSANAGMAIYGTGQTTLAFASGTSGATSYQGYIQYTASGTDSMVFATATTERMRLNSTGALVLAGGTTTANGVGITFPATQSASSDANTLDDYEEGTWTPSIGGTATYSVQSGLYTKIGRIVTLSYDMTITTIGTGSSNTISGVPFTTTNSPSGMARLGASSLGWFTNSNLSVYSVTSGMDSNTNQIYITCITGAQTSTTNAPNFITSGTRVAGTITITT